MPPADGGTGTAGAPHPTAEGAGAGAGAGGSGWFRRFRPGRTGAQETRESLATALAEAEYLLQYIAEAGIDVGTDITGPILRARRSPSTAWNGDDAAALLAAIAKLSAKVSPVTGETLRACAREQRRTMGRYLVITLLLAGLLVPLSAASFVSKGVSNQIRIDGEAADALALRFVEQIGRHPTGVPSMDGPGAALLSCPETPKNGSARAASDPAGGAVQDGRDPTTGLGAPEARDPRPADLQEFATRMRSMYWRARQLHWLAHLMPPYRNPPIDPLGHCVGSQLSEPLQLAVPLGNPAAAAAEKVRVYQHVRSFARTVQADADLLLDAVGAVLLPILYALLGAIAYMWRTFGNEVKLRIFAPSYADWSRLLTAGIGGSVVGLFPGFSLGEGPSIAPLGIAFLVGYGIDIFFTFLDGLTPTRAKARDALPGQRNTGTQAVGARAAGGD